MQTLSNHTSVTNQSTPTLSPAHEALLAELFTTGCHINKLLETHNLTPTQFLAFATDPIVIQTLDAWEALQERHHRMLARQSQLVAADHLDASLLRAHPTPEARRVATSLGKLTTHMISPTRRRSSPAPSGGGGRVFEAGGGSARPPHRTQPTSPPNPTWLPRLSLHTPTSTSEFECLKFDLSNLPPPISSIHSDS